MATHRITAPVSDYAGEVGHVVFGAGVATLDEAVHSAELAYFRQAGYGVEEIAADPVPAPKKAAPSKETSA